MGATRAQAGKCEECEEGTYQDRSGGHRESECLQQIFCTRGNRLVAFDAGAFVASEISKGACIPCGKDTYLPSEWHRAAECIEQPLCGIGKYASQTLPSAEATATNANGDQTLGYKIECLACPGGQYSIDVDHRLPKAETCIPQPVCNFGQELQGGSSTTAGDCIQMTLAVEAFWRAGELVQPSVGGDDTRQLDVIVGGMYQPLVGGIVLDESRVSGLSGSLDAIRFGLRGSPPGFFVDPSNGAISGVPERTPSESDASGEGDINVWKPWNYTMQLVALDSATNEAVVETFQITVSERSLFGFNEAMYDFAAHLGYEDGSSGSSEPCEEDDFVCQKYVNTTFGKAEGNYLRTYARRQRYDLVGPTNISSRGNLFKNFGASGAVQKEEQSAIRFFIKFERNVDAEVAGVGPGGRRRRQRSQADNFSSTTVVTTAATAADGSNSSTTLGPGNWFVNRATGDMQTVPEHVGNFSATLYAHDTYSKPEHSELVLKHWWFEVKVLDVDGPDTNGPNREGCNHGKPVEEEGSDKFDERYICECETGYLPPNCNNEDESRTEETQFWGGVVGGIAVAVIVLIALIFVSLRYYAWKLTMRRFNFEQEISRLLEAGEVDADQADASNIPREIARRAITITIKLGSGAFGDVCKAILDERIDGTSSDGIPPYPVAVKTVRETGGEAAAELFREAALMQQVASSRTGHPNLVSIIGVVTKGVPLYLVLSICDKGSLLMVLADAKKNPQSALTWTQKLWLMVGTARGMRHLATKRYVHRDLAGRNVLVDSSMTAKIADFGLSRGIHESDHSEDEAGAGYYYRSQSGVFPVRWSAPESMESLRFTSASDCWSFGILLFEIISDGQKPYPYLKTNDLVISAVSRGKRMPRHPECDDHLYEALLLCWRSDPADRPSFDDLAKYLEARHDHAKAAADDTNHGYPGGDNADNTSNVITNRIAAINPEATQAFVAPSGSPTQAWAASGMENAGHDTSPTARAARSSDAYLVPNADVKFESKSLEYGNDYLMPDFPANRLPASALLTTGAVANPYTTPGGGGGGRGNALTLRRPSSSSSIVGDNAYVEFNNGNAYAAFDNVGGAGGLPPPLLRTVPATAPRASGGVSRVSASSIDLIYEVPSKGGGASGTLSASSPEEAAAPNPVATAPNTFQTKGWNVIREHVKSKAAKRSADKSMPGFEKMARMSLSAAIGLGPNGAGAAGAAADGAEGDYSYVPSKERINALNEAMDAAEEKVKAARARSSLSSTAILEDEGGARAGGEGGNDGKARRFSANSAV